MKNIFILISSLAVASFAASCEDVTEGAEPGSDSRPSVVLYQYAADGDYDADLTTHIRLAVNSATEELYLLAETVEDYEQHSTDGSEAYAEYVQQNGEQIQVGESLVADKYIELPGDYKITAVAVKGSERMISQTVDFSGMSYSLVEGLDGYVYTDFAGGVSTPKLYVCDQDPTLYRLKGVVYSALGDDEFSINFSKIEEDGDGNTYLSVPAQATPYEYGSYGTVFIRDIATYQNNSAYSTAKGYCCYMTPDHEIVLVLNVYVSAGNIKQIAYETFALPSADSEEGGDE